MTLSGEPGGNDFLTMSSIQVRCPKCSAKIRLDESQIGKKGCCKTCETKFVIQTIREEGSKPAPPVTSVPESQDRAEDDVPTIWNVGDVILDPYEVTGELGEGEMGNWHQARHELRQQTSLPTLNEFHDWLTAAERQVLPKSPAGQAIGLVFPCWEGFTHYCDNGALSIDDNLSERMVRPVAIGRKIFLFLGSGNGGKAAAILDSLVASAKLTKSSRLPTCETCSCNSLLIAQMMCPTCCPTNGSKTTPSLTDVGQEDRWNSRPNRVS